MKNQNFVSNEYYKPKKKGEVAPSSFAGCDLNSDYDFKPKKIVRPEKSVKRNMGTKDNPIFEPDMIFARKYRFALETENGSFPEWAVSKVEVKEVDKSDHRIKKEKRINVWAKEVFKNGECDIEKWLQRYQRSENTCCEKTNFILTTYDGCGSALYSETFEDIRLLTEEYDYNYDVSDVSEKKLGFSYSKKSRVCLLDEKTSEVEKKEDVINYTVQLGYLEGNNGSVTEEIDVLGEFERPSVDIEETELNYLNVRTWLPGKAKWQPVTMKVKYTDSKMITSLINRCDRIRMSIYVYVNGKRTENWIISPLKICKILHLDSEETVVMSFMFENCEYKQYDTEGSK